MVFVNELVTPEKIGRISSV